MKAIVAASRPFAFVGSGNMEFTRWEMKLVLDQGLFGTEYVRVFVFRWIF